MILTILFRLFGNIAPKPLTYLAFQFFDFERHQIKVIERHQIKVIERHQIKVIDRHQIKVIERHQIKVIEHTR